jgi:hypothetical protein
MAYCVAAADAEVVAIFLAKKMTRRRKHEKKTHVAS